MIYKQHGFYIVTCDMCEEVLEDQFESWDETIKAIELNFWVTWEMYGKWKDICPECQE